MMTAQPAISVIIVSYNTRSMTLDCLRTLYSQLATLTAEVFVVDNASRDGSADAVAEAFPEIRVIRNPSNAGFGAANNLALQMAAGRYILLLNSDAFPHDGCVAALVRYLDDHPAVGLVGPRLVNPDGSLQRSCWRFPSPLRSWLDSFWLTSLLSGHPAFDDYRRWPHDSEREVDFVIGACLLVRREAYEQVGGFDERFFMYQEETDWQLRLKKAGWRVMFTPSGTVTHLGGASGKDEAVKINAVFFESLDRYSLKHFGKAGFFLNRLAQVAGAALRVPCWAVLSLAPGRRVQALRELHRQIQFLQRHLRAGLPA
jgi:GT2 family glycosyltransferase